ncbi:hypothetical protein M388_13550 [Mesotoga sp. Brook.08.YT.4.2.5.4.]|nr:hypothetical protein M388_13550 [Mesotoga sp. Brook.08.YT.4.2.5.4.]
MVARRRRTSADARLAKNMPGRNAGKEHAGTQGCLRQEAKNIEDERKNTYLKGGFFR